ncbi:MAG: Gfo/Idh/MocA family oxidoreductase [Deltaproteobacteria bacterium]|nr:Gfo/Idh/MocA family oxidoreductase [Deltaproteobacteria bacterium]
MNKIRAGVIGVGYLGAIHAQKYAALAATGAVEFIGVFDADQARAREIASANNAMRFASVDALLSCVDAVSIATPTAHHFTLGMRAIEAGKDVLVEKPITTTALEAKELVKAAEKANTILQVGHLERFNAAVVALEGVPYKPVFIQAQRLSPFPNRSTDVDVVLDLMIHDIDIILNLVKSEIESIDAVGTPVVSDKVDVANARIRFVNGCVADVTASRVSSERVRRIQLFESSGYITIDYAAQHIFIARPAMGASQASPAIEVEQLDIEKRDSLLEEIRSFIGCCARRTPPLVSGVDGLRALEAAETIQNSMARNAERVESQGVRR